MDSTEIIRNIADIVDENGVRAPGVLEILSSMQMDTRYQGIEPETVIIDSGSSAVANQRLLFCPAGSEIVIFDVGYSSLGVSVASFHDQNSNLVMGSIYTHDANGTTVVKNSKKGIPLGESKSLFFTTTSVTNWDIEISFAIIQKTV